MSLVKHAMKLKCLSPVVQQQRNAVRWGGFNHVVNGPPVNRYPFWQKMVYQGSFVVFMFSYPLYVTYMMHEWDLMDGNI